MRESLHESRAEPNGESTAERPAKQPHPTDPRRWSDGTQRPGASGLATKHGAYAQGQRSPALLENLGNLDAFRSALEADQGGREELTTICNGYVGRLTEVEGLCRLLRADLMEHGIFTKKRRVRSTFAAFLTAVEKWDRLAQRLGMERRTRRVNQSPVEWLESLDTNREKEGNADETAPDADQQAERRPGADDVADHEADQQISAGGTGGPGASES
jgi:hypothetical protein